MVIHTNCTKFCGICNHATKSPLKCGATCKISVWLTALGTSVQIANLTYIPKTLVYNILYVIVSTVGASIGSSSSTQLWYKIRITSSVSTSVTYFLYLNFLVLRGCMVSNPVHSPPVSTAAPTVTSLIGLRIFDGSPKRRVVGMAAFRVSANPLQV